MGLGGRIRQRLGLGQPASLDRAHKDLILAHFAPLTPTGQQVSLESNSIPTSSRIAPPVLL